MDDFDWIIDWHWLNYYVCVVCATYDNEELIMWFTHRILYEMGRT